MATIQLPRDFSEFLKSLNSSEVRYLVVGGYAVNYHGYPRTTGDLDIWISPTDENEERTAMALRNFGFIGAQAGELFQPGNIVRMGVPPLRLEIMTAISGVDFEDCYTRRVEENWDGVLVPILSREDLIRNKKATGRLKDRADVEELS